MAASRAKKTAKKSAPKTSVRVADNVDQVPETPTVLWGEWDKPLVSIKGIGPARAAALMESRIKTLGDLLYYFPRRYVDRSITEGEPLLPGRPASVFVHVQSRFLAHGRKSRLVVHVRTLKGEPLSLVFFRGVGYFGKLFEQGQTLVVSGKVEQYGGLQMVHPDFEFIDEQDEKDLIHVGRIIPLYPSTDPLKRKGLDSRGFRRLLSSSLDGARPGETLPQPLVNKYKYLDRAAALSQIHFPQNAQTLGRSIERLKYEELFLFSVLMVQKRKALERFPRLLRPRQVGCQLYREVSGKFPFTLTNDQTKAIDAILGAAQSDHPAALLLQGDVGSGKTAVALSVALHYLEAGCQVAMMAPTEVLARQHYRSVVDLVGLHPSIQVALLTAQDSKKAKEASVARIASGEVNLIIGTHSLIEPGVAFRELGLVIIDEQHRFGVEQRETLRSKGKNPDILAMTATPIPRTLCLTEFADLELVTLKEKPAGRKPIKTMWLGEDKRAGLYKSIRNHVSKGRQCYIVYPVIEDSEKSDLKAATEAYEELHTSVFSEFSVALLHGRLKSDEKDRTMRDFREGRIQILVSTTVIEVGVDVPNATIMVVEHADRFGISQLHQLRGRVGRGSEESFCVVMADNASVTEDGRERLEAIVESQDGFYLAEVDLKIRGPGELLGNRQHGIAHFRLADLVQDRKLAENAFHDAREFADVNDEAQAFILRNFPEAPAVFSN